MSPTAVLRGGNAHTGRGAASFLDETFARARAAGAAGSLTLRADSGFSNRKVTGACDKAGVVYSSTVKLYKSLHGLIAEIPEADWTPITYWIEAGADVAETTYRPFSPRHREVRLIVRRTKPTPGSQLALLVTYDCHALITNRDGPTVEIEADHRRHAEIENAIRDLKYGVGLNHLPSGRFAANAAWLALNVIAHNLARLTSRIFGGGDHPSGSGLDDHHADAVRDHVVQLPRHTTALVACCVRRPPFLLVLQAGVAHGQLSGQPMIPGGKSADQAG